ncbi:MAG: hypothetical protein ABR552_06165, partial [Actinomycetota bacterium]
GLNSPAGPQTGIYDEHVHQGYVEATALNAWTADTGSWFRARSPELYIQGSVAGTAGVARALPGIHVPTLIIQGTIDTLFPMIEGIHNEAQIAASGVPTKMIFFCGGHTSATVFQNSLTKTCLQDPANGPTQSTVVNAQILAWLDRYVKGDRVNTGPHVQYQLQDGTFGAAAILPPATVRASGSATVVNQVVPTSGALLAPTHGQDGTLIPVPVHAGDTVLGLPVLNVKVSGEGTDGELFFKLVDRAPDGSYTVADDQVTPLRLLPVPSSPKRYSVEMTGYSWRIDEGHSLFLEVSSTSNDYESSRVPALMNVDATIAVPVVVSSSSVAQVLGKRISASRLPATGVGEPWAIGGVLLGMAFAVAGALRRARA